VPQFWVQLIDWLKFHSNGELLYVFLIVVLFIVPRLLLRFGIPMALTAFGLGVMSNYVYTFDSTDKVTPIFSTLGIISLFLFAGLEVDVLALRNHIRSILGHISFRILVVVALAVMFSNVLGLNFVAATILALALATPSTGFILDSVETSSISDNQKFWIKLKAISAELVALVALLAFSQLGSLAGFVGSFLIIAILIVALPFLLKRLAGTLESLAPGSEFGLILMLAIISGIVTKSLGAYYLVGAFIVGMATGQYKRQISSKSTDQILHSLRSFSAFFIPFYFFNSNIKIPESTFTTDALGVAAVFFVISIPLKMGTIVLHRRISQDEPWIDSVSIALSLMPNLVFGLVLADILKDKMGVSNDVYGGVIIYTLLATGLSPLVLKLLPNRKKLHLDLISGEPMDFTNRPRINLQ
jgi:Kef-type K+ transport system membrane component KefB